MPSIETTNRLSPQPELNSPDLSLPPGHRDNLPQMPGPGFASPSHPGPEQPDPLPDNLASGEAGGSASSEPKAPTRIDLPGVRAKGKAYGKIAAAAFKAVGGLINQTVAVDDADDAFLPDGDDLDTVPPPLGRLAARKVPLGNPDNLSDVEDIGQAVVGLIAWGLKVITEHLEARRERGPRGRRQPPTVTPAGVPLGPDEIAQTDAAGPLPG